MLIESKDNHNWWVMAILTRQGEENKKELGTIWGLKLREECMKLYKV